MTEYTRYCKLAASKAIYSDNHISARDYRKLLESGYVWSKISYGEKEGEDCWYNIKTNDTKYLKDMVKL